ncbi:hypothetical protein C1H46_042022 [Malus baccata]|uniref:Uncharacterized protein n=1 Tax=Malus baccata TaxID=106549 RepID=A0A540KDZ0_MALBA|nr:hypothetical protein C1H46_042022 [Malus baccata]
MLDGSRSNFYANFNLQFCRVGFSGLWKNVEFVKLGLLDFEVAGKRGRGRPPRARVLKTEVAEEKPVKAFWVFNLHALPSKIHLTALTILQAKAIHGLFNLSLLPHPLPFNKNSTATAAAS